MREASWWKRVQRHELQQLHGREERPPSSQHDHQREEGHRPRRYFANQAAGWHLCPRFSGLQVGGHACPVGLVPRQSPLPNGHASLGKSCFSQFLPTALHENIPRVTSTFRQDTARRLSPRAWYHSMRPAREGRGEAIGIQKESQELPMAPPLP